MTLDDPPEPADRSFQRNLFVIAVVAVTFGTLPFVAWLVLMAFVASAWALAKLWSESPLAALGAVVFLILILWIIVIPALTSRVR